MHDPNGSKKPLPESVGFVFGQAEATCAGKLNDDAFRQQFGPAAYDEVTNSAGLALMRKPTAGQSGKAQVFAAASAALSNVLMTNMFDHTTKKKDVYDAFMTEFEQLVNNPVDTDKPVVSKKRKTEKGGSGTGASKMAKTD